MLPSSGENGEVLALYSPYVTERRYIGLYERLSFFLSVRQRCEVLTACLGVLPLSPNS